MRKLALSSGSSALRPNRLRIIAALVLFLVITAVLVYFETVATRTTIADAYETYFKANIAAAGPNVAQPVHFERVYPDMDCWCWMHYAEQIYSGERLRVRWAEFDNAPFGRPVHWGSLFAWLIAALAKLGSLFIEPAEALRWAGDWISPLLRVCGGVFALMAAMRRGLGLLVSTLSALAFLMAYSLLPDFSYGRPDHQSLHDLLALCAALAVLNVVGRPPAAQKRWMIYAAAAGATGLWVGATVQAVMIAVIGVAGMAVSIIASKKGFHNPIRPEAWRAWGRTGFVLSLLFYIVEYAPHFPMQLEVNHPFYSIAWLAGAELAAQAASVRANRSRTVIALCFAGILLLPSAVLFGPAQWYVQRDPALLGNYGSTSELKPYVSSFGPIFPIAPIVQFIGFLTVLVGTISLLLVKPELWRRVRRVSILFVIAALLFPLVMSQIRWTGFFAISIYAATIAMLWIIPMRARVWLSAASLCLATGPYLLNGSLNSGNSEPTGVPEFVGQTVAAGYLATALGADAKDCTVLNSPNVCPFYLCDLPGVRLTATPYWEDVAGLRAVDEFFGSTNWEAARRIAMERKARYILVHSGDEYLLRLATEKNPSGSAEGIKKMLLYHLTRKNGNLPAWIRPVAIPKAAATQASRPLLYEIVPGR